MVGIKYWSCYVIQEILSSLKLGHILLLSSLDGLWESDRFLFPSMRMG